ncbi:MAG: hypothetical protein GF313_04315 [Caldithrix sp.]|nr:hypothetical protein [Caldithrix sp.]
MVKYSDITSNSEIIKINDIEKKLRELPDRIKRIRELITRFERCGSFNIEIKAYLEKDFLALNDTLNYYPFNNELRKNELIKTGLLLWLVKTIKENIKLSVPFTGITLTWV